MIVIMITVQCNHNQLTFRMNVIIIVIIVLTSNHNRIPWSCKRPNPGVRIHNKLQQEYNLNKNPNNVTHTKMITRIHHNDLNDVPYHDNLYYIWHNNDLPYIPKL